ncbi:PEP-CTERM sorting domain-containing protein, partial [bacterium]
YGFSNQLTPAPLMDFHQYLSTSGGGAGTNELYNAGFGADPNVRLNRTGGTSFGVPNDFVGIHPGPNNQLSMARWTAPSAIGTVNITGAFLSGDSGAVDVYVVKNASTATPVILFSAANTFADQAFATSTSVTAGDTIDFIVGAAGNYNNDSTPLLAHIAAVPEPGSIAALGLGAAALLRRRKRA